MQTPLNPIKTASFFGAFTTPLKLAVIKALLAGPVHVTAIGTLANLEQPLVSQTLTKLRALGLVTFEQVRSRRYYALAHPEQIRQLLAIAESHA